MILGNLKKFDPLIVESGKQTINKLLNDFKSPNDITKVLANKTDLKGYIDTLLKHKIIELKSGEKSSLFKNKLDLSDFSSKVNQKTAFDLFLMLSPQCNLKCSYCMNGTVGDVKNSTMSFKTAVDTINFYHKMASKGSIIRVAFFGGEPLLQWELIKKLIGYIEEKKKEGKIIFEYSIPTNLTFVPENFIHYAKKYKIHLICDIDGPEKIHNQLRPSPNFNSFKKTTENIKHLVDNQIDVNMRSTICSKNVKYISKIINLHHSLGGATSSLIPITPSLGNKTINNKELYPDIKVFTKELQNGFRKNKWSSPDTKIYPFSGIINHIFNKGKSESCGIVFGNEVAVDAFGNIYPCVYNCGINSLKLGNIYKQNEDYTKKLYHIYCMVYDSKYEKCSTCSYNEICNGGCPLYTLLSKQIGNCTKSKKYLDEIPCMFYKVPFSEVLWHIYEDRLN